ncbi:MAG: sensor histidine kinase [Bacilli bacterium]|nr:sensor histidine kinase [Bacilli bacterium]
MNFYDITIHDFLETLVEWVFEYYVLGFGLFWSMPKRSRFPLRYLLGIALLIGISYPLAIFYNLYGYLAVGRAFVYITLFSLSVVHHIFCYKAEILKTIVFCDLAYLLQNACYKIFIAVYSTIAYANGGLGNVTLWQYKLIYYLQLAAQYTALYFTLIPAARRRLMDRPLPRFVVIISAFTVIVSVVYSAIQDIYIQKIADDLYGSPDLSVFLLRQNGNLAALMLDGAIVILLFAYSFSHALRKDINDLHYLMQQSAKQYEISQQTIDTINIKCHDMKHRINKIVGGSLPEDAIRDINESIAIYDALIDTGNKALDVIITEKNLICESRKIAFTKTLDGKAVSFLSEGDLFCLFGNLLDNAIEAVSDLEDPQKRYINLGLKTLGEGIVQIECVNYYAGERVFDKGLPRTTKGDEINHGFGMLSIREIVQKYSGDLTVSAKDGVFTVAIVFFCLPNAL